MGKRPLRRDELSQWSPPEVDNILISSLPLYYLAIFSGAPALLHRTTGITRVLEASYPFQDSPSFVYLKAVFMFCSPKSGTLWPLPFLCCSGNVLATCSSFAESFVVSRDPRFIGLILQVRRGGRLLGSWLWESSWSFCPGLGLSTALL